MNVIIDKIWHREAFQIGIYFKYDVQKIAIVKAIGANFSKTLRCWYVDYSREAYSQLKNSFENITVKHSDGSVSIISQKVTDSTNRDHLPIAKSDIQLGTSSLSNPEHTKEEISLAKKLRLTLLEPIGKYWIFKMQYHQTICKQLLVVKGVYWNTSYKCYMTLRHPDVKQKVEQILEITDFFGTDYLSKDTKARGAKIEIKVHLEHVAWMEVHVPKMVLIHEKMKRFKMARFSNAKNCYLLPAAPAALEAIQLQMENIEVLISNQLPAKYLQKRHLPNRKQMDLQRTRDSIFTQVPESARAYISKMVDTILALNYSDATLRNYTHAFIKFLKHFEYKDPATISNAQIIPFLASIMLRGLAATSGHTMVNSLQFYYHNVLQMNTYTFKLPRPKNEKKLPTVLTMEECLLLFQVVDNPKHKLLLLIGYGAGLRVSEIVTLKWSDILFSEHKIHLKNAKGKKDRMVMLPYSIVQSLQIYKELYNGKQYVFEGQFAGEPYSTGSVQSVMRQAIKKSGLDKKATVHSLRHSFATHLLENGTDIRYIQKFLGHASIKTTTVYTHLTKTAVDKIKSPLDIMVDENNKKKLK